MEVAIALKVGKLCRGEEGVKFIIQRVVLVTFQHFIRAVLLTLNDRI